MKVKVRMNDRPSPVRRQQVGLNRTAGSPLPPRTGEPKTISALRVRIGPLSILKMECVYF